jgi:predicted  nucleic acid-binding Zn-ribbon protein
MSNDCSKVEEITTLNERMNAMNGRIERLERNDDVLSKLVTSVEVLAERMINVNENMEKVDKKVDSLTSDVKKIELEPADNHKWLKRQAWGYVVIALLGAVVGKVLSLI